MNKKKLIFGGVILVLVLVAAWYFMYFTKTPGYASNQAREAYTKHDVATFKKYVDVESIVGSGYDDFVAVAMESPEIKDNPMNGLASAMFQGMKGQIVPIVSSEIYSSVGKKLEGDLPSAQDKAAAEKVRQDSGIDDLTFKDIGSVKENGDSAVVPVTFTSKSLNQDFTFEIAMEKKAGNWKAVKVNNFKDFLKLVEKQNDSQNSQEQSGK